MFFRYYVGLFFFNLTTTLICFCAISNLKLSLQAIFQKTGSKSSSQGDETHVHLGNKLTIHPIYNAIWAN